MLNRLDPLAGAVGSLILAQCGGIVGGAPDCEVSAGPLALPAEIRESSGAAYSRVHPGIVWTHNDSNGGPYLYAIDESGGLVTRLRVAGATNRDWEDLASAPCGTGSCLYIADTGDNARRRAEIVVYRIPEPPLDDTLTAPAEPLRLRLPDGPRDIEAIAVRTSSGGRSDEHLVLVSKGRGRPPEVYAYPGPLPPVSSVTGPDGPRPAALEATGDRGGRRTDGQPVTLELLQTLGDEARSLPDQITGASASADGRLLVLRTYQSLHFHGFREDGTLIPLPNGALPLRTLYEAQGEGVALGADGRIALTSETGPLRQGGSLVLLRCREPG